MPLDADRLPRQWGGVVATLVGSLGDFDLAEEAAQQAFEIAAARWPVDGVPASPRAWLLTTARRRAIDRVRRDPRWPRKVQLLGRCRDRGGGRVAGDVPDERLELIFICCHPALAIEAQVALRCARSAG